MTESKPDTLFDIESALRCAVVTDAFAAVDPLLGRYREEVERRLRSAPEELPALQIRTQRLFNGVLAMLQVSRDDAYAKLERLKLVSSYDRSACRESNLGADA